ncbi:fibrocystin-L [Spea bombifrons]|uniref:fibrocystin-L n=1 Tax=Spea bombifrons TaxID=233779 RepID=UPI00234A3881|nr:fibrocystin-L [Spea bombifrons]
MNRFLVYLFAVIIQAAYGQVKVSQIIPSYGSVNGAVRITIKGQGFAEANQFNYGDGSDNLGNSVLLVSAVSSIPCDVEKDASHATQITCYTRPMPEGSYVVRVSVDGYPVEDTNTCGGKLQDYNNCVFQAFLYITPVISSISPLTGTPGSMVTIRGRIFTDVYGSNTALSSNGRDVRILRVYAGGMPCELLMPNSDTLYGLQLDGIGSDYGSMICKLTGTYVGQHNVSFILDSNYGRSFPTISNYFVSSVNKISMFQTYAEITGIFPSSGSVEGGTLITIDGRFFDQTDSPAKVLVGGQDCVIIELTDTRITCRAPRKPLILPALYPGGRGLKLERWINSQSLDLAITFNESTTGYVGASWVDSASKTWPDENSRFIARFSGFLVAPETDYYNFYIKGYDSYALYFSESGNPADKVKVAYGQYSSPSYYNYGSQKSEQFQLQEGKPYYIEFYILKMNSVATVDVGLYKKGSSYIEQQTRDAVNEIQNIQSQTTQLQEKQIITLQNWNKSTSVGEVQTIRVTKYCELACSALNFKLIYDSEATDYLSADATASEVQSALNSLWSLKPDSVQVTMETAGQSNVYRVTFNSQRGDFKLLSFEILEGSNMTVDIVETTPGTPDMNSFTLVWDGIYSKPLPLNASSGEVQEAILDLVSSQCPDAINNRTEGTAVKFFRNYETDFTPVDHSRGILTSDTEAFCGRYSLKNPEMLFHFADLKPPTTSQESYGSISLTIHSKLCFAYKGYLSNFIGINFQYEDSTGTSTVSGQFGYNFAQEESWTYTCIDMLSLIRSKYSGKNFLVNWISLQPSQNLYIDDLYIGQIETTNNLNVVRRRPALANKGIFINSVSVTSGPTDQYTVTIDPFNCGFNLPLFSVGFAANTENNTENAATYRAPSWPQNAVIQINRTQAASPPIGGTFSVQAYGKEIKGLKADISRTGLQYALQTIPELGQVSVSSRTGGCSGYTWQIKFLTASGYQPLLQINDSTVTGVNANISAVKVRDGGLFRQQLIGDILRTPHEQPQVEVYINGIPSRCSGNCGFKWVAEQTPAIESINVTAGLNEDEQVLIINGKGFSESSVNDTTYVKIGEVNCPIINVTANEIRCLIQKSSAGTFPIRVYVAGAGFATPSEGIFTFTHEITITSVSPSAGSLAGGTLVTIGGSGFSTDSVVQFGGAGCDVEFANLTFIHCRTQTGSEGSVDIVVFTNGMNRTLEQSFLYSSSYTPVITEISPNSVNVLGNTSLIISGFNFSSQSTESAVFIGKELCKILEWNPTNITCILPSHLPGTYTVLVHVADWGFALSEGNTSIEYILQVNSIFPQYGSLYGGTEITLKGSGFHSVPENNEVRIGSVPCNVTSSSESELTCVIQRPGKIYTVTNNGKHSVYGVGYAWTPARLDIFPGDTVVWTWGAQSSFMNIGYRVFSVSDPANVTYDGEGFISGKNKLSSGVFSYQFTAPGVYYYSSGYVDNSASIFLQGVIYVSPAEDNYGALHLSVSGIEAKYLPAPDSFYPLPNCTSPDPDCPRLSNVSLSNSSIWFGFSKCYSPSITSITPSSGTVYDLITINGTGFSDTPCAIQVSIGKYPCRVTYSDKNSITCQLDPQNAMSVGVAEIVSVTVNNYGNAINTISNEMGRRFVLLPHIDSVQPRNGSNTGYTRLTIHGTGLSDSSNSTRIEGLGCSIVSVNYTDILCDTEPGYLQDIEVKVDVRGIPTQCKGSCFFSYTNEATPVINNVSPTVVRNITTTFYINGTGFGTDAGDVLVYVGDVQLEIVDVNDTAIVCLIEPLPVGNYSVKVIVLSKGLASGGFSVNSPAEASLQTTSGSIEGGTVMVVQGNGFEPLSTTVLVGGIPCPIISVVPGEIQCLTPPTTSARTSPVSITVRSTTYPALSFSYSETETPTVTSVVPETGPVGTLITISGSRFGVDAALVSVTIGGAVCNISSVSDDQLQCNVGNHSGGTFSVRLQNEKGFARSTASFKYELTMTNVSPREGNFAGGLIITVTGSGFDQQTSSVFVCNSECKVDRLGSNSNFLLCEVPPQNDTNTTTTCDVQVVNGNDTVQINNSFSYLSTLTPEIYDVSPKRGGTAGGTRLTITGSQFSSNVSLITVTIAQAKCEIQSVNSTHIVCITSAQSPSQKAKVKVHIEGQGLAKMNNTEFFYIDVWSSKYTWGGESPPEEGSLAVITKGQTILLDQSTPVLKMLLIQGGTLIFDEADIELQSENILITDGGVLQIGTETDPFKHKAIITLHGQIRSPELPLYGAKTLAVREGTLDLHGLPVPVTWTRLAQTAEAGTSTIILQKSVTWKVGDEIVIASTGHRHSQKENEKRTIKFISPDGTNLTLTEPLTYKHLGISVTLPDNTIFEARAEVGLLTRNVVVRGSNNVEWNDKIEACPDGFDTGEFATQTCFQGRFGEEIGSDQFGGCIMFHAPQPNKLLSIGRIEYVEIFHAGQAFRLGRYPIHWHLMGDLQFKSYVRGCGIHQTYNRAVTIHNTHHLLIENNVIYDIMGGAFFIEDGIEHGNVLQYNLAVFVRQSTSLLNDDVTPAAFWVTNPNNTIRHNAAAGGTHFGFWYRMHNNPDGPSYDPLVCQKRVPLGEFYNNTVHSQGWFGIWIFEEYFPMETGSCYSTTPKPAIFNSLTTWNCHKGAEWVNGGALQFHNFTMINNEEAGIETKRVISSYVGGWGETTGALIKNAIIVGHVDELGLGSNYCTSRGVVLPFDEGLTVSSVKFMNFDRPSCAAIGVTTVIGLCADRCGGWSARFGGIQYFTCPNKAGFRWEHEVVLIDTDGTLAGTPGYKVVPESGLLDPLQCRKGKDWSVGFPGYICNATVSFHRLAFNNPQPSSLAGKDVIISNAFGVSVIPYLAKRLTHKPGWMALLPNANSFNWHFKDVDFVTNISYASTFYGFKSEDYVFISHNFTQRPDMFNIIDKRNSSQSELSYSSNSNGDWFFNNNTTTLTYLVSGKKKVQRRAIAGTLDTTMSNINVKLQVYQCYFKDCIAPPPSTTTPARPSNYDQWSNSSFWQSSKENDYTVPKDGSNVVIPADKWVVADVDLPSLERLTIYGVLELRNLTNMNMTATYKTTILSATYISIQGGALIAGKENDPFQGELHIILKGNHSTPEMPLRDGPNQGSKVLGVFGHLDLHGIPRSVYKTKLANTTLAGSPYITLVDAVDWQVGEDILITTTSYDAWQTETRKIIAISGDKTNLTLNASLTFTHTGETYQVPNTNRTYTLAADVALLSRNIKIIGQDYPGWYKESFGARVLVSSFFANNKEYKGSARIDNVEFYHSGQLAYSDPTDPRYSIAFLNLGEVAENTSYVRGCSFHNGFAPAIGVFATNGLDLDDNIVHFAVGDGIKVWGERIRVRRNLVALAVWPGSYQDREEPNNIIWNAGIEINKGSDIVLQNNVVAGFERIGYRIDGEPCPGANNANEEWFNNEAHGGLYGVYMNEDGLSGCSLIRRFHLWKCWDYGIYTQTIDRVEISEVVLADNGMGIFPIIFSPAATSHQTSNKTVKISNSLLVGSSPKFDCKDVLNGSDVNIKLTLQHRSSRPLPGGRSGICWPTFASAQNGAPLKPHAGIMSYNAISGLMTVQDTTFVGYKSVCSGETNVMFMTNPLNEDLQHPIHVSRIQISDSSDNQKVFIHRPDVSKANPSDCVDMDCDAKKKSLLKDLDGSFLGSKGAIIPQSEYQWDGEPSHGLGDYRIPKVMLTRLNGSRIPVSEVAPYKGIIRDSTCAYMSAWGSYRCNGLNYEMLVIESLDADTETRRLSPVAVLGDGYVDLINGPQDHGWCSGYTCQRRVSLFHSIVATNKSYDIFFTSSSPQNLRLILLNTDSTKAVRVGIFFSNPQRLDVYANGTYVYPSNAEFKGNGKDFTLKPPIYEGQYLPKLNSTTSGENYFDNDYKMLYILVRGSTPIGIYTSPLIVIAFNIPAMTVDQFYGENLVKNLAIFLKIPASKIRITKIVQEGSRKRRAAGGLTVSVEIADTPSEQRDTTNTTGGLTYSDFQSMSKNLAAAAISGSLSSHLNVTISSLAISDPVPSPSDPGWSEMASQTVNRTQPSSGNYLATVSSLKVVREPIAGILGQIFTQQPAVMALDSNGNCVSVSTSSLSLTAKLKDASNNYVSGGLGGNVTIKFSSCWANYTDLALKLPGKGYILEFVLNNVYAQTKSFSVKEVTSTTTSPNPPNQGNSNTAIHSSFQILLILALHLTILNLFMDIQ